MTSTSDEARKASSQATEQASQVVGVVDDDDDAGREGDLGQEKNLSNSRNGPRMQTTRSKKTKRRAKTGKAVAQRLSDSLKLRREWDVRLFGLQQSLFVGGGVSTTVLRDAVQWFTPELYDEVVTERASAKLCGYPACHRPTTPVRGRYRISAAEGKVYDVTELASYCGHTCMAISKYLKSQLSAEPAYLRDPSKLPDVNVLPADVSPDAIVIGSSRKDATTVSRDELMRRYVASLLSRLPHPTNPEIQSYLPTKSSSESAKTRNVMLNAPQLVIKERDPERVIEPSVPALAEESAFAVEGFVVRFSKDNESNGKSTEVLPEYVNRKPKTQAHRHQSQQPQVSVKPKKKSVTWDLPTEEEASGPEETMHREIAAPHKPVVRTGAAFKSDTVVESTNRDSETDDTVTNTDDDDDQSPDDSDEENADAASNASTASSSNSSGAFPRPAKIQTPSLSLFGRSWLLFESIITPDTKALATHGTPMDVNKRILDDLSCGRDMEAEATRLQIFSERIIRSMNNIRKMHRIEMPLADLLLPLLATLRLTEKTVLLSVAEERVFIVVVLWVLAERERGALFDQLNGRFAELMVGVGLGEPEISALGRSFLLA